MMNASTHTSIYMQFKTNSLKLPPISDGKVNFEFLEMPEFIHYYTYRVLVASIEGLHSFRSSFFYAQDCRIRLSSGIPTNTPPPSLS